MNCKNNVTTVINVLHAIKEKICSACFKTYLELSKTNYSFNDFKQRKMTLPCSRKTVKGIYIKKLMAIFIV